MRYFQILLVLLAFLYSCKEENRSKLQLNYTKGSAFGTTYSVQFLADEKRDYTKAYDSLIAVINQSMSTYQKDSDISRINKGDSTIVVDDHFKKVFQSAQDMYEKTNGVFDPTIGILVNAWNFGPENHVQKVDSLLIDSLMQTVGFDRVRLKNNSIIKQHSATFLDFNALAKGYAVDVFSEFLASKGNNHYLVEIGGEIRAHGRNKIKNKAWKIGLEDPNFDGSQSYSKVISLQDEAMATSGSYRKFKLDEKGNRYAHIINTKTGHPYRSNVLSVSVISDTCMKADGYATALMSMKLEEAQVFLKNHPELKVFFIYDNPEGELETLAVNGFPE